jgi:hypothetical protein
VKKNTTIVVTRKQEVKKEVGTGKNFTAKIKSISRIGEVVVKFNATLNVSAGIEYFTNQTSLKILPAS